MSNQTKPILNPFNNDLQLVHSIERGIEISHNIYFPIVVKAGFSRLQANMNIQDNIIVTVEDTAELIVL